MFPQPWRERRRDNFRDDVCDDAVDDEVEESVGVDHALLAVRDDHVGDYRCDHGRVVAGAFDVPEVIGQRPTRLRVEHLHRQVRFDGLQLALDFRDQLRNQPRRRVGGDGGLAVRVGRDVDIRDRILAVQPPAPGPQRSDERHFADLGIEYYRYVG